MVKEGKTNLQERVNLPLRSAWVPPTCGSPSMEGHDLVSRVKKWKIPFNESPCAIHLHLKSSPFIFKRLTPRSEHRRVYCYKITRYLEILKEAFKWGRNLGISNDGLNEIRVLLALVGDFRRRERERGIETHRCPSVSNGTAAGGLGIAEN